MKYILTILFALFTFSAYSDNSYPPDNAETYGSMSYYITNNSNGTSTLKVWDEDDLAMSFNDGTYSKTYSALGDLTSELHARFEFLKEFASVGNNSYIYHQADNFNNPDFFTIFNGDSNKITALEYGLGSGTIINHPSQGYTNESIAYTWYNSNMSKTVYWESDQVIVPEVLDADGNVIVEEISVSAGDLKGVLPHTGERVIVKKLNFVANIGGEDMYAPSHWASDSSENEAELLIEPGGNVSSYTQYYWGNHWGPGGQPGWISKDHTVLKATPVEAALSANYVAHRFSNLTSNDVVNILIDTRNTTDNTINLNSAMSPADTGFSLN